MFDALSMTPSHVSVIQNGRILSILGTRLASILDELFDEIHLGVTVIGSHGHSRSFTKTLRLPPDTATCSPRKDAR